MSLFHASAFRALALFTLAILPRFGRAELPDSGLFARTNLVAWCIVPFDSRKRGPEERAKMLDDLGIRRLAYDWRAEHVPTFDTEISVLRSHGIELTAWWFPADDGPDARAILECLRRNRVSPQLWVTMGTEEEPDRARLKVKMNTAFTNLTSLCKRAAGIRSTVGLYNHLGWFGEPSNQLALIQRLHSAGLTNVGIIYNFHHGHAHIEQFPDLFRAMKPHLLAVNLNGMVRHGDRIGKKIIPLGTGTEEAAMLRAIANSGWQGPIGILGHTDEDAEVKLSKELEGLARIAPR